MQTSVFFMNSKQERLNIIVELVIFIHQGLFNVNPARIIFLLIRMILIGRYGINPVRL